MQSRWIRRCSTASTSSPTPTPTATPTPTVTPTITPTPTLTLTPTLTVTATPSSESLPLTFAVAGDSRDGPKVYGRVLEAVMESDSEFLVHTGDLVNRGTDFFFRHGGKSVFMARFIGPLRPVVPAIAGIAGVATPDRYITVPPVGPAEEPATPPEHGADMASEEELSAWIADVNGDGAPDEDKVGAVVPSRFATLRHRSAENYSDENVLSMPLTMAMVFTAIALALATLLSWGIYELSDAFPVERLVSAVAALAVAGGAYLGFRQDRRIAGSIIALAGGILALAAVYLYAREAEIGRALVVENQEGVGLETGRGLAAVDSGLQLEVARQIGIDVEHADGIGPQHLRRHLEATLLQRPAAAVCREGNRGIVIEGRRTHHVARTTGDVTRLYIIRRTGLLLPLEVFLDHHPQLGVGLAVAVLTGAGIGEDRGIGAVARAQRVQVFRDLRLRGPADGERAEGREWHQVAVELADPVDEAVAAGVADQDVEAGAAVLLGYCVAQVSSGTGGFPNCAADDSRPLPGVRCAVVLG